MKRITAAIKGVFVASAILAMFLLGFVLIWPGDLDYLSRDSVHYKGMSDVTSSQVLYLQSEENLPKIYNPQFSDNGTLPITYDFFSVEAYPYLTSVPYNVWDMPLVNSLSRVDWVPVLIAFALFFGGLFLCASEHAPIKAFRRGTYNLFWHLVHPETIRGVKNTINARYCADIQPEIHIEPEGAGLLGVRTWKYVPADGLLHSLVLKESWKERSIFADKSPEDGNKNGLHAFQLGTLKTDYPRINEALGIVSLTGNYTQHADMVIRAERCEMLLLILAKHLQPYARSISCYYGVPVVVTEKPVHSYLNWFLSENGIKCLQHNAILLKDGDKFGNEGEDNTQGQYSMRQASTSASV